MTAIFDENARKRLLKDTKDSDFKYNGWKVKDIEWIKDCPVPKGEDFKRLPILWKE